MRLATVLRRSKSLSACLMCEIFLSFVAAVKMKVAIVGAGISGVVAGAYLREVGIDIVLFERNNAPGGVW